MVDLGIYNFVKNALAAGKTREEITTQLTSGSSRLTQKEIDAVFSAVSYGRIPHALPPTDARGAFDSIAPRQATPSLSAYTIVFQLIIIIAAVIGIVYFSEPAIKTGQEMLQNANLHYEATRVDIPGN